MLHRLLVSGSDRHAHDWQQRLRIPGTEALTLDQAYIRGHVFCTFLALLLRKDLMDRLTARHQALPEWQQVVGDLLDLSEIEIEQDGRRALLRAAPGATVDALCRAAGVILPPVFQDLPHKQAA